MLKRVLLLTAVLGLVAAACGGEEGIAVASVDDLAGSPNSTVASIEGTAPDASNDDEPAEEISTEQALLNLAACMRDEGIDMEDPQIDGDGNFRIGAVIRQAADAEPEEIRAAMDACSEHLEGVTLGFRDFDLTELQDQMLEFAACMRDNGFEMPDPDFSSFGPSGGGQGQSRGPFGEIDPDDSGFLAALEECQGILSFGRFSGGGTGRGGNG